MIVQPTMNSPDKPLAELLRMYRAQHNLQQKELADAIGLGVATLCRLEQGSGGVSAVNLLKVMQWLMGGEAVALVNDVAEPEWDGVPPDGMISGLHVLRNKTTPNIRIHAFWDAEFAQWSFGSRIYTPALMAEGYTYEHLQEGNHGST